MDVSWLTADASEVAAAMQRHHRASRPSWVPTRRRVVVHVNHCLMLWYLCIAWMVLGVRIDSLQDHVLLPEDVRDIVVVSAVFLLWVVGTVWLYRWALRPPSPRARLREWRQDLTALANGFRPAPATRPLFSSLITDGEWARTDPRFVGAGGEFGNIEYRTRARSGWWRYGLARMPVPLPHMVLDSRDSKGVAKHLPVDIPGDRRLSLEGDFDRWFRVYVPKGYERDALFVFTPDVMAALIDDAPGWSVEIVEDRVVFFQPGAADYSAAQAWSDVEAVETGVLPMLLANAERYRDERDVSSESVPRVAPGGQHLNVRDRRTGGWWLMAAIGWGAALVLLYVVPGIFAFAGFMSVVDGR